MLSCRTPLIASAAANAVNLSLDLFFVFVAGWGVVGAASAATIGQYVGLATMLYMLCRKGVLRLQDLKSWPSLGELIPMAQVSHQGHVLSGRRANNALLLGWQTVLALWCKGPAL